MAARLIYFRHARSTTPIYPRSANINLIEKLHALLDEK